jgi:hypothetical protein
VLILAVMADKSVAELCAALATSPVLRAAQVICTSVGDARSLAPEGLAAVARDADVILPARRGRAASEPAAPARALLGGPRRGGALRPQAAPREGGTPLPGGGAGATLPEGSWGGAQVGAFSPGAGPGWRPGRARPALCDPTSAHARRHPGHEPARMEVRRTPRHGW